MQPGSLVGLVKPPKDSDREYALKHGWVLPEFNQVYVVTIGPYPQIWEIGFVEAIQLEEFGDKEWNASFFAELQPPQEISIEEIISESEVAYV